MYRTNLIQLLNILLIICISCVTATGTNDISQIANAEKALEKGECTKAQSYLDVNKPRDPELKKRTLQLLLDVSDCQLKKRKVKEAKEILYNIIEHEIPANHPAIYRKALSKMGKICSFYSVDEALLYFEKSEFFEKEFGNDSTVVDALLTTAGAFEIKYDDLNARTKYYEALNFTPQIEQKMRAYLGLGNNTRIDQPILADSFFQEALKLKNQTSDSIRISSTHSGYGNFLIRQGKQNDAIRNIIQANDWLPNASRFDMARASNHLNIASLFLSLQRLDRAEEYLLNAISIQEKNKYKSRNGLSASIFGQILFKKGKYDQSELELQKAQAYYLKRKRTKELLNVICERGRQKIKLKDLQSARMLFDTATVIITNSKKSLEKKRYNSLGAELNIAEKNFNLSARYATENLNLCEKVNDISCLLISLSHLYVANRGLGNFKSSLEYYERYRNLLDETYRTNQNEKIFDIESQYKRKEQDQAIALLDAQNETNEILLSEQRKVLIGGAVALGLISLLSFFLFRLYRKVNDQKGDLKKALNQKDTLLREIHHRVKNNLQLVSSLLTLQSRSVEDKAAMDAINAGKSRVRSMALIHQDLYSRENLTGIGLKKYLEKLTNELFNTYHVQDKNIQLNLDIQDLELDIDTVIPLGLIINELVTNSLKYAFKDMEDGRIDISLNQENDQLVLKVKDNGAGFAVDEVDASTSFGSKLIQTLTEQLEGELKRTVQNGTEVVIRFNEYKIAA